MNMIEMILKTLAMFGVKIEAVNFNGRDENITIIYSIGGNRQEHTVLFAEIERYFKGAESAPDQTRIDEHDPARE